MLKVTELPGAKGAPLRQKMIHMNHNFIFMIDQPERDGAIKPRQIGGSCAR